MGRVALPVREDAMKRRAASILLLLVLAIFARTTFAAEISGVTFSDNVSVDGTAMKLNGVGLFRYAVVFKVYVAALYLGAGATPDHVLDEVPKRLEVEYLRGFRGPEFGDAGDKVLAQNVSPATVAAIRARLDRMNSLYEDVKPGDRSALTYVPGHGTELSINGRSKGWVEGADFAAAYFQIWLGAHPLSDSFRDQLLTPLQK